MADGWRDRAIVQLTLARYREFYREPEALFWTFIFPILTAAGLALAFRSKPPEVLKVGVVTGAGAAEMVTALKASAQLDVRAIDDTAAERELRTGKVALLVVPNHGGPVEFRFDDTRPEGASARRMVDDALQRAAGRQDPVPVRESLVRERGSRYIDFLIPGLLGMNLMASSMWGIGFSVVDQRRKKLLKRFVATPMSRTEYLASFVLARLTLLILEVTTLVGVGVGLFGVPLRGSVAAVGLVSLIGAMSFGGLGLLIAARPKTIEAASGMMNLAMLPMWVFSGVFFSVGNFPDAMQPFIRALPLTAVNDALRATMLEGATLPQLAPEFLVLIVWLVVSFTVALKIFRWK
ncbi:MAG: ABC transporter permease [Gemmatimonadetes bacterium]|nr:ABC transporter permease [Gemmatimonadota bacterium]